MRGLRKLLSSVLVAGVVLGTFSTGVSAGFYTADEEGLKDIRMNMTPIKMVFSQSASVST